MSGNYPDGVNQSDIDRAHDGEKDDGPIYIPERIRYPDCQECKDPGMHPSHEGSSYCQSGSIKSGGTKSHCTCDWCF